MPSASRMMSGTKIAPAGPSRWMAVKAARRTSGLSSRSALARCGLITSASSSRLPSVMATASRTSACSSPSSRVSRANAGCAAFPSFPSVCAAIVRIFGAGSSSKRRERRDGLRGGRAVAADHLGGREPNLQVGALQLADDAGQRLATRRTERPDACRSPAAAPSRRGRRAGNEIAEQASSCGADWKRIRDGLDPDLGRRIVQQRTDGRDGLAARGPR